MGMKVLVCVLEYKWGLREGCWDGQAGVQLQGCLEEVFGHVRSCLGMHV
jgi:hypothetical protein